MRKCDNCKYLDVRPNDEPCIACDNKSEWMDKNVDKVIKKTITISQKEYARLIRADNKLEALECFGVDNWGGYSDAMQSLEDEDEE